MIRVQILNLINHFKRPNKLFNIMLMIFMIRIQILNLINHFKRINQLVNMILIVLIKVICSKMINYLIKINKVLEIKDLISRIILNNKIIRN